MLQEPEMLKADENHEKASSDPEHLQNTGRGRFGRFKNTPPSQLLTGLKTSEGLIFHELVRPLFKAI